MTAYYLYCWLTGKPTVNPYSSGLNTRVEDPLDKLEIFEPAHRRGDNLGLYDHWRTISDHGAYQRIMEIEEEKQRIAEQAERSLALRQGIDTEIEALLQAQRHAEADWLAGERAHAAHTAGDTVLEELYRGYRAGIREAPNQRKNIV